MNWLKIDFCQFRGKEVFAFRISQENGENKVYCIDITSSEAEFPDIDDD